MQRGLRQFDGLIVMSGCPARDHYILQLSMARGEQDARGEERKCDMRLRFRSGCTALHQWSGCLELQQAEQQSDGLFFRASRA